MTVQIGTPASANIRENPRAIETPEFLMRVAEELRIRSGSDLPLSCFVEQVKLQLAGGKSPEELENMASGQGASVNTPHKISETYNAWAMPH
ncbi:hypothetical protein [Rhizobium binxianense]